MTREEIASRYNVPQEVLENFDVWYQKDTGADYTDQDLEKIESILTLSGAGLDKEEIREYLGAGKKRPAPKDDMLRILNKRRKEILSAIHEQEKKISRIDYLRYQLEK